MKISRQIDFQAGKVAREKTEQEITLPHSSICKQTNVIGLE